MTDVGLVRMMEQLRSEIDELKAVEEAADRACDMELFDIACTCFTERNYCARCEAFLDLHEALAARRKPLKQEVV